MKPEKIRRKFIPFKPLKTGIPGSAWKYPVIAGYPVIGLNWRTSTWNGPARSRFLLMSKWGREKTADCIRKTTTPSGCAATSMPTGIRITPCWPGSPFGRRNSGRDSPVHSRWSRTAVFMQSGSVLLISLRTVRRILFILIISGSNIPMGPRHMTASMSWLRVGGIRSICWMHRCSWLSGRCFLRKNRQWFVACFWKGLSQGCSWILSWHLRI